MDHEEVCRYSYTHWLNEVPATTVVDLNSLGTCVPACQSCADFYKEMSK